MNVAIISNITYLHGLILTPGLISSKEERRRIRNSWPAVLGILESFALLRIYNQGELQTIELDIHQRAPHSEWSEVMVTK